MSTPPFGKVGLQQFLEHWRALGCCHPTQRHCSCCCLVVSSFFGKRKMQQLKMQQLQSPFDKDSDQKELFWISFFFQIMWPCPAHCSTCFLLGCRVASFGQGAWSSSIFCWIFLARLSFFSTSFSTTFSTTFRSFFLPHLLSRFFPPPLSPQPFPPPFSLLFFPSPFPSFFLLFLLQPQSFFFSFPG